MPTLPDLPPPSKIICIGRNYVAHINELNNVIPDEPVLFLKPPSSISRQLHTTHSKDALHYETELCFVIKDNTYAGIGLGLDLTKRVIQNQLKGKGLPWERAKAFDGSAVFTPFLPLTEDYHWSNVRYSLHIDQALAQSGNPNLMIFNPDALLYDIKQQFSLMDGDIIMTGTPEGVGKVTQGATYKVSLCRENKDAPLLSYSWVAQ